MRRAFDVLFTLFITPPILFAAFVIGTLGVLPFVVLPKGRREQWAAPGAALFGRVCVAMMGGRTQVDGTPADEGALYICNHRSWVDPVLILGHTNASGLSKSSIFWIPFVGLYAWIAGAVFFDRSSREGRAKAREDVLATLRAGNSLFVFPEGTRSRDGKLRSKVFLTLPRDCYGAGLPVVPCAVMGTERIMPADLPVISPFHDVRLVIGGALRPADFESEEDFAVACWAKVKAMVGELEGQT